MTTLKDAPLIEVIFEIKWGEVKDTGNGGSQIKLTTDEISSLPQKLQKSFTYKDVNLLELINTELTKLPHFVTYRYRKGKDIWPCFQLGNGIFTVNQLNEEYKWRDYVDSIKLGLDALNDAYSGGLDAIPLSSLELRYQDGFFFSDGETQKDFLSNNLNVNYSPPDDLLESEAIQENSITQNLSFAVKTTKPQGVLINSIANAHIEKKPGLVMSTRVLSNGDTLERVSVDHICEWLENAHSLQQKAFETLINPTYLKSLK